MASAAPKGLIERMFARKSVAQVQRESANSELKRTLGKWNLLLLGVGCIIGAGIFVRTGSAAALHAGPAVLLSFVVAGVATSGLGLALERATANASGRVGIREGFLVVALTWLLAAAVAAIPYFFEG